MDPFVSALNAAEKIDAYTAPDGHGRVFLIDYSFTAGTGTQHFLKNFPLSRIQ